MLTSSNQYLRPDYLSPLPTTLDAKKSPLALLAQTCSAIGADSPNPKLISAAEKASKKYDDKPVHNDNKPSFKPYESCLTAREKTRTPEDRASVGHPHSKTPLSSKGSTSTTPVQARCGSNQSSSSQRTPPPAHRKTPSEKSEERSSPLRGSPVPTKSNSNSPSSSSTKLPYTPTSLSSSSDTKEPSSFKPSVPVTSTAFLGGMPPSGFPLPMDIMTSSLMAAQHHALKNGLNPYLAYARMKAPGSDLGICRDPYCTGCSLSSHLLKSAVCPAGCAQCDHAKTPFTIPSGHPAAAAYAHAQLAALAAASQLPYVCSWMAGDSAYCGKRFASSDELLQHLRSHTASSESNSSLSMLSATHPLLQRTYPTPPLSPLTPRFHPYSKPSHLVSSPPLPFPLPPHPSLAAYFPSYPLFGPRPLHP
ncbi:zinc finger protein Elbow isoform X2 [Amyelois transitella]|uniref:zinc finger protein Elbow isoform X2 n=1 Tax=Amyelois transitella TaxID=680683 RepID=UPI00067C1890|nr:zinc finger protein Elbow isoform X2 [Amyelois transitella]